MTLHRCLVECSTKYSPSSRKHTITIPICKSLSSHAECSRITKTGWRMGKSTSENLSSASALRESCAATKGRELMRLMDSKSLVEVTNLVLDSKSIASYP